MNIEGTALGIAIGLIIVFIVAKFIHKDGKFKTEYDERQLIVRGKSYTYAFWAMGISNVVMLCLATETQIISILGVNAFFIPIFVGILTQVSYSIFHDAYKGINDNMTRFMIIFTICSVINLSAGIIPLINDNFIQDGKVYPNFINLICGILFIIIVIEMLIRKAMLRKEE